MSRYFNPRTQNPQNAAQEGIRQTHDRLVEAGHEDQAARLRRPGDDDTMKAQLARQLEAELLTPPTLTQQIEQELAADANRLSEADRETVEARLSRAHTLESSNPDLAEELRERALALAKHGPPQSHADDLPSADRDSVEDLLARAETMAGIDPGVSSDLESRAADVIADTVRSERGGDAVDSVAIERDVEATITDLTDTNQAAENADASPGRDMVGDEGDSTEVR